MKNLKFEKYTSFKPFKPHLIHYTAHVTTKMRCGAAKPHYKVQC